MRSRTFTSGASALLLLATLVSAKHGVHDHLEALHKRHRQNRDLFRSTAEDVEHGFEIRSPTPETAIPEISEFELERRGGQWSQGGQGGQWSKSGQCAFPSDAGLVAVTPSSSNGGWAMSPDQPCTPGNYCPYACPPGQISMQWDPDATSYSYPMSMVSPVSEESRASF